MLDVFIVFFRGWKTVDLNLSAKYEPEYKLALHVSV